MSDDIHTLIAKHSPLIHFVYVPDKKEFINFNQSFKSLTGVEAESVSEDEILNLVPADEQKYLKSCYKELLDNGIQENIDLRLLINQEEKWLRITAIVVSPASGKKIIAYATDITAETRHLNTLKKFANKKNSILNILSHDLRGPLGIANMITQVIDRKVDDPELLDLTNTVSKIIKQSIDLITDLTAREFLETADVELVKSRVNIAVKLQEYMEEVQKNQDAAKRVFKFSSSPNSIFLNLDEPKFIQVINNLMTNALKFTREEGVISLEVIDQNNLVLFTFRDDGIGIPEKLQSSIFEEFSDARRRGLHGEQSTGLGLSIVKTIIGWHNGKIWFESKENQGTTFYIEIPREQ